MKYVIDIIVFVSEKRMIIIEPVNEFGRPIASHLADNIGANYGDEVKRIS